MLIQYVLDNCIASALPWSLIVSSQLARFTPPHSSLRNLCVRCVSALYSSGFSSPTIDREHSNFHKTLAAKLFRINAHSVRFLFHLSTFRMNTSKSVSKQRTLTIFSVNTYEKRGRGRPVIVNQESVKDSCPEKHRDEGSLLNAKKHFYPERPSGVQDLSAWHSHSWLCSCRITGHGARNCATPRIMCPPLQESTACAIASSAAPDGMSVKLATACG